jgi:RNA polymerase sigma factor (sigma-70 family)
MWLWNHFLFASCLCKPMLLNTEKKYKHLNDQELLEEYRHRRNKEALGFLLQRYTLLLLGVCMKYLKLEEEAKDTVQQVFSKAIVEVDKYPVEHFKSWLYTIARNYCFMQLRNKMHPLPEDAIEKNGNVLHQELFEETLGRIKEKEKILEYLEDALQHLQTNQRECLSLFYLEKLSYRQIGEKTGLSLLQIKSYIQNGKRNMRLMIEKKMKEDAS